MRRTWSLEIVGRHALVEMANKPVSVGITRTRPRFDGKYPL